MRIKELGQDEFFEQGRGRCVRRPPGDRQPDGPGSAIAIWAAKWLIAVDGAADEGREEDDVVDVRQEIGALDLLAIGLDEEVDHSEGKVGDADQADKAGLGVPREAQERSKELLDRSVLEESEESKDSRDAGPGRPLPLPCYSDGPAS